MTDYPKISIRVSHHLDELLDLLAQREGVSKSKVIKTALQQYLADQPTTHQ